MLKTTGEFHSFLFFFFWLSFHTYLILDCLCLRQILPYNTYPFESASAPTTHKPSTKTEVAMFSITVPIRSPSSTSQQVRSSDDPSGQLCLKSGLHAGSRERCFPLETITLLMVAMCGRKLSMSVGNLCVVDSLDNLECWPYPLCLPGLSGHSLNVSWPDETAKGIKYIPRYKIYLFNGFAFYAVLKNISHKRQRPALCWEGSRGNLRPSTSCWHKIPSKAREEANISWSWTHTYRICEKFLPLRCASALSDLSSVATT